MILSIPLRSPPDLKSDSDVYFLFLLIRPFLHSLSLSKAQSFHGHNYSISTAKLQDLRSKASQLHIKHLYLSVFFPAGIRAEAFFLLFCCSTSCLALYSQFPHFIQDVSTGSLLPQFHPWGNTSVCRNLCS